MRKAAAHQKIYRGLPSKQGFSVIVVMSLASVAMLAVLALTASLIPVHNSMAAQMYANESRSVAENGIQYAVGYLNQAAASNTLSGVGANIPVPQPLWGSAQQLTVTQALVNPTGNVLDSPVYNSQNTPSQYRTVTAVAQYGIFTRTINVVLGPSPYLNSITPTTPYFTNAILANQALTLGNQKVSGNPSNVNIMSDTGGGGQALSANISSNQQIQFSLTGANAVDGNVTAYVTNSAQSGVTGTTNSTINGNLYTNGQVTNPLQPVGSPPPFTSDQTGGNVFGDGAKSATIPQFGYVQTAQTQPGGSNYVPVQAQSTPAAQTMTASASAEFSSPMQGEGGTGQTITVTQPEVSGVQNPVYDLGAINLSGNTTLVLPPGTYTASSINIANDGTNSQIQIQNSATNPQPTQIYLQGQVSGSSPASLAGGGIVQSTGSTSPNNLQIYYNGTQPISVSMQDFQQVAGHPTFAGYIYAPNANVTIHTGQNGSFHGAVVGNNVKLTGQGTLYYNNVAAQVKPGGGGGPGYASSSGNAPENFQILSWQEM